MESQIHIPHSFIELFRSPNGKLHSSAEEILTRYELCEDLAQALTEQAQTLYHSGHSDEGAVLYSLYQGLSNADSGLSLPEAQWCIQRLAELLQWRCPLLTPPEGHA